MTKPSNSPSVHFGAGPTFYGSSASGGTTGTYLPYGTPSIQTYFQPTSQTSNNVSQLHSSSHTSNTNQNFVALSTTPQQSLNVSGTPGTILQASTKSPFQNTTSTTTSTTVSPSSLFNSKKYNKGGLTSNVGTTSATGGNTSAQRSLSPSYEEDTVSNYLFINALSILLKIYHVIFR